MRDIIYQAAAKVYNYAEYEIRIQSIEEGEAAEGALDNKGPSADITILNYARPFHNMFFDVHIRNTRAKSNVKKPIEKITKSAEEAKNRKHKCRIDEA